ncbi:cupin-like domain-containing protein [Thalassobellus suaedae]|uniref:Cupin-like domain-containing protein n=1 Tax=Thalassobellus suaedae TaxID=3074124 RepID=A0ABY9XW92_9FLAO|nr:cupin-like domain-containing protein [Flavobacteriaceae bacterium HL-DH14]WNH12214.1 cupin-like domain-containing protein [Flavobacteriaceae bacterium HL-DH10]
MNIKEEILLKSKKVEQVSKLDSKTFKKDYFNKKTVLIKGLAKNWKATQHWDLDFFLNQEGDNDIELLSGNFIQGNNSYKSDSFKNFIHKLIESEKNGKAFDEYLTTLNIFNYYPNLKKAVDFSLFENHTTINDITAWIGPSGTISGFHRDTGKNMYAQIKGKKMFIICSPKFNKNIYPSKKYINGGMASEIDLNNYDKEKHPKFQNIQFETVILEPGDVLHVPSKWWHYVESLDSSISISNFGYSKIEMFIIKVIDFLHRRGYYKKKNCFCCN